MRRRRRRRRRRRESMLQTSAEGVRGSTIFDACIKPFHSFFEHTNSSPYV
jgi:hypothetical protein